MRINKNGAVRDFRRQTADQVGRFHEACSRTTLARAGAADKGASRANAFASSMRQSPGALYRRTPSPGWVSRPARTAKALGCLPAGRGNAGD